VLVVEDSGDQRDVFAEELRAAGFTVLEAADGQAAIESAILSCPEAMVLDLMLPAVSGFHVARLLRSHPPTSHMTIVAVTALTSETLRERALEVGCDSVIRKPALGATVVAEVARLLARGQVPPNSA
jgi:DNA-binding response OmpR family regulator